jgi:hypothetical protein
MWRSNEHHIGLVLNHRWQQSCGNLFATFAHSRGMPAAATNKTCVMGTRIPMRTTKSGGAEMILNQGKVAQGLVDELLALIHSYDETLYMSTVIGCLELVKQQLINESLEDEE